MSGKVRYIKVARIDGDGNDITNTLENLTEITLNISAGNRTYPIVNRTRQNDFYLYYVNPPGTNDIPLVDHATPLYKFTGSMDLEQVGKAYGAIDFTTFFLPISSSIEDSLNFYNSIDKSYQINTYPQKDLHINLTGSVRHETSNPLAASELGIYLINPNDLSYGSILSTPIATTTYNTTGTSSINIKGTLSASDITPGYEIRAIFRKSAGGAGSLFAKFESGTELLISSSAATGDPKTAILEPYLSQLFFNQGCDVLINNVSQGIPNQFVNDLDYSTTTTVPINFDAIVSGSAAKSTIPQSHYTQLSSIIPRYLGAKSTSQKINTWTSGDTGSFGKLPNVNSLNNVILFCEWIGGNAPERMDAVTAKIKYLIYQDGTVEKPNLNEFSLYNLQNAFRTGENLKTTLTADDPTLQNALSGLRKIIRGGARIENILTTQTGSVTSAPENNFPNDIIVKNIDPSLGQVNKFNFSYSSGSNALLGDAGGDREDGNIIYFPNKIYDFANDAIVNAGDGDSLWNNYYYAVTTDSEYVSIKSELTYRFTLENTNPKKNSRLRRRLVVDLGQKFTGKTKGLLYDRITGADLTNYIKYVTFTDTAGRLNSSGGNTGPGNERWLTKYNKPPSLSNNQQYAYSSIRLWAKGQADQWNDEWRAKTNITITVNKSLPTQYEPVLNITYYQYGDAGGISENEETGLLEIKSGATITSQQTPPPAQLISPATSISSSNKIWSLTESFASNPYTTYTLTSSAAFYQVFSDGANDPVYVQESIPNWGFDEITSPISFKQADEFRFMGTENNAYTIESFEKDPDGNGGSGTVKVTFTEPLPISSSYQVAGANATLQWDWFNVRRYTDNSDYVIFQAVKPAGASGTSIIKPQYVVDELDKGVNEIILDLTEKGLIS